MSTPPTTPAPQQMSPEAFGQMIKAKYPQYKGIDDAELASKVLLKYPQYRSRVSWSAAPPKQPAPAPAPENRFTKFAKGAIEAEPSILGGLGGVVGGMLGGPVGAVAGAAYGGAAGEAGRRRVEGLPTSHAAELKSGAAQGALEYVGGQVAPRIISAAGRAAARGVDDAITKILGVRGAKLEARMASDPSAVREVGKVVDEEVRKNPKNLDVLHGKLQSLKDWWGQVVDQSVQSSAAKKVDTYDLVHQAVKKSIRDSMFRNDAAGVKAASSYEENLPRIIGTQKYQGPEALLQWKRKILNDEEWRKMLSTETNLSVSRGFRERLYGDLDKAIRQSLQSDPRALNDYIRANRKYTNLSTASDWLGAKIVGKMQGKAAAREAEGGLTKSLKAGIHSEVAGMTIGAGVGGAEGYRRHGFTGLAAGAAVGAGLGAAVTSDRAALTRLAARRGIRDAAPSLAKAAAHSPQAARALKAIEDIRSQNQQ